MTPRIFPKHASFEQVAKARLDHPLFLLRMFLGTHERKEWSIKLHGFLVTYQPEKREDPKQQQMGL